MSRENKLVNKIKRRERFVREPKKDTYKVDKSQETLQASPRAYKLMRKPQRRMDASFGYDAVGAEPYLEYKMVAASLDRFDFGVSDFGLRLTLPASIAGNVAEVSKVTTVADTGAKESFTVTAAAFAGTAQADYFTFEAPNGDIYAVWLDKNAANVPPTGAAYLAADQQVEVEIVTGNTAAQVAAAIVAALGSITDLTITDNLDGTIDFDNDTMGARADAARHNANDSGNGSFLVTTSAQGADSNLNSSYFLLDSPTTDYYVWYNVGTEGVDPMVPGRTGVPVAVAASASANTVATATASAVDALAAFVSAAALNVVTITDAQSGPVPDTSDGAAPTGFTFSTFTQGATASGTFHEEVGFEVGDLVVIEEDGSQVENRMLEITAIINDHAVRLDDVSTFSGTETNVTVRFIISGVKKSYV